MSKEVQDDFAELCKRIGSLSEAAVLTTLVESALKACIEAGYRMPLPLKFQIVEGLEKDPPSPAPRIKR